MKATVHNELPRVCKSEWDKERIYNQHYHFLTGKKKKKKKKRHGDKVIRFTHFDFPTSCPQTWNTVFLSNASLLSYHECLISSI